MLSLPRVRVTRQPRTDPAILGGVRALVPLLIPVAMIFSAPWVGAENADWSLLQKAFKDTWKIDGLENAGLRSKLRARKRAAVKGLRKAHDARAVPVLMGAHKKQLKFIGRLEKQWAKRRAAWEKLQPAMEKALQAKQKTAGPDGNIRVTPGEKAWIDERMRLDNLRRSISNEEEIAEYTRKAMARICNTVEGKEAGRALAPILKAAGDGTKPDQREFIRVLGHVQGEAATAALEGLAAALRPVVAATALRALGRQNAPRSVTTLLARLDDPRWQLRVASLEGLSFFKDARVVDALLARLPSEDGVLRRHYYTALSRILDETLPTTIEAWASWWKANRDRVVKRWAEKADGLPIPDDLPAVALKSEGNSDSTSFYGLKTESKHIIFVIDVSGSMGEQGGVTKDGKMRIDIAKRELKNAIRSLSATEHDEARRGQLQCRGLRGGRSRVQGGPHGRGDEGQQGEGLQVDRRLAGDRRHEHLRCAGAGVPDHRNTEGEEAVREGRGHDLPDDGWQAEPGQGDGPRPDPQGDPQDESRAQAHDPHDRCG